jgi:hypothetical protein
MEVPPLPAAAAPFPSTVSQAFPPSQLSIASCLSPDGTFDVDKYQQYAASLLARARGRPATILSNMVGGGESHAAFVEQESTSYFVKLQARRCVLGCKDTEDGPLCVITPEQSGWYRAYVSNFLLDDADSFMAKKFRNRFRLPYPSYKDLLYQIEFDDRFDRWCGYKRNAKKSSPVELLLLGSLRYLGRGWTFDDIEEQTAISISVHRKKITLLLSLGALLFILCMLSHRFILLRCNRTWQSTRRRDFLVVLGHQIVLTSQRSNVSTTLKTTILAARVVILLVRLI